MATELTEEHRQKLDSIVKRMTLNLESDENIRWVVNDFKQKYATTVAPSMLTTAIEPFKRAAKGLINLPGSVVSGLSQAGQVDWGEAIQNPSQILEAGVQTAKDVAPAVLPTVGAVVGAPFGPGGMAAGAIGGEFANQAIGQLVTGKPQAPLETLTRAATAGVIPSAIGVGSKAAAAATRAIPRIAPGGSAALQEEAASIAKTAPTAIRTPPSERLYQLYNQAGPAEIPTVTLQSAVTKIGSRESQIGKSLQEPKIRGLVKDLTAMTQTGQVPLEQLRLNLSRAGKTARALEESNPEVAGALKKVFEFGWKDIETAAQANTPQAFLLKQANRAYRKEMASETLKDWIEGTPTRPGAINTRTTDGLTYFSPGKVIDKIRRDKFFRDSLEPGELKEITDILDKTLRTPALPPPRGANYGSALTLGRGAMGGGAAGYMTGDPAIAGLVAGVTAYGPMLIAKGLMTKPGRALLSRMLETKNYLTPNEIALLSGAVNADQRSSIGPPQ